MRSGRPRRAPRRTRGARTPLYVALARMGDRARGLGRATTSLESVELRRDLGVGGHTVVRG